MAITYTPEQEKIAGKAFAQRMMSPETTTFADHGDFSQATVQILDLSLDPSIGEKVYTLVIRDPQNLEGPTVIDIHMFPDGTVQAEEYEPGEDQIDYGIPDLRHRT